MFISRLAFIIKRLYFCWKLLKEKHIRCHSMSKNKIVVAFFVVFVGIYACSKEEAIPVTTTVTTPVERVNPFDNIKTPADNPITAAKVNLGKLLFWDPILSGDKDVACVSCHHPDFGYAENLDISIGSNGVGLGSNRHFRTPNTIGFVKRNAHTVLNTAYNGMDGNGKYDPLHAPMFWDIRKKTLELQSLEPIKSLEEMRGHHFTDSTALDSVVVRLKNIQEYRQLFTLAFGSELSITAENIGKALATFERTLTATNSRFDAFERGDKTALTEIELTGMQLFQSVGCINCHSGPMFSDYQLHILSVPDNPKLQTDSGTDSTYAFRTPTLRNLKLTGPYMHNGIFAELELVLDFYDTAADGRSGNSHVKADKIDPKVRQLNVRNKQAIMAFLMALSDDNFDKSIPTKVPSQLNVGGNIK
jgi:cytochrome c peroxidase